MPAVTALDREQAIEERPVVPESHSQVLSRDFLAVLLLFFEVRAAWSSSDERRRAHGHREDKEDGEDPHQKAESLEIIPSAGPGSD